MIIHFSFAQMTVNHLLELSASVRTAAVIQLEYHIPLLHQILGKVVLLAPTISH